MSCNNKHLFVSVGTTKFDELIERLTCNEFLDYIRKIGFASITFQTGNGRKLNSSVCLNPNHGLAIKQKPFFGQFNEEVRKADLVICHAGAGTCIEVMRLNIPLIVVINESLMDNHQIELAEALQNARYLLHCTVDTLQSTLGKMHDLPMLKYPTAKENVFCTFVDQVMGFQ